MKRPRRTVIMAIIVVSAIAGIKAGALSRLAATFLDQPVFAEDDNRLVLGIRVMEPTQEVLTLFQLPGGASVIEIDPGSLAEKAGLKLGDVILSFDNKVVSSLEELGASISKATSAEAHTLLVLRGENRLRIDLPATSAMSSKPPQDTDGHAGSVVRQLPRANGGGEFVDQPCTVAVTASGLTGTFADGSLPAKYYQLRWSPKSDEITMVEPNVVFSKQTADAGPFVLLTGYQSAGTEVRVKIEAPSPEQLNSTAEFPAVEQVVDAHYDLVVFEEQPSPGLDEVEIHEIEPGLFTWTPLLDKAQGIVCGPKVVGLYVTYQLQPRRTELGGSASSDMRSVTFRVGWMYLGCPGETLTAFGTSHPMTLPTAEQPTVAWGPSPAESANDSANWYVHGQGLYRFRIPAGWEVVAGHRNLLADEAFDSVFSPDKQNLMICWRITKDAEDAESTLQKYMEEKQAQAQGADVSSMRLFHMVVGNAPAFRLTFHVIKGPRAPFTVSRISFVRFGRRHIINTISYSDDPSLTLPAVFRQALESLEFTEDREQTAGQLGSTETDGDDAELGPFPDEREAMQRFDAAPNDTNRKALAQIRAQYAATFWEQAQHEQDADALSFAFTYCESATRLDPDSGGYWFLLAKICLECADNPLAKSYALDAAEKAVHCRPKETRYRLFLAELQLGEDYFSSALDNLESAIGQDPTLLQPRTIAMLNVGYLADGQSQRGITFYEKHLSQQPNDVPVRIALAIVLQSVGRREAALQQIAKVKSTDTASIEMKEYANELATQWTSGAAGADSIGF